MSIAAHALRQGSRQRWRYPIPSKAPARVGRVSLVLMREAWALRLKLSGFSDIEDQSDPDAPLARENWYDGHHGHVRWEDKIAANEAYFRALRISAMASRGRGVPGARYYRADRRKDRRIANALANGESRRSIAARLRVGHSRIKYVRDLMLKHAERLDERDGD